MQPFQMPHGAGGPPPPGMRMMPTLSAPPMYLPQAPMGFPVGVGGPMGFPMAMQPQMMVPPMMKVPVPPTLTSPPMPIRPEEKINLYVGKIPPNVSDDVIKKLLSQCGKVAAWRRMSDPGSGALKGFGFCEYESPEGVRTALRLLNNLKIGNSNLLLKVDDKNQKILDAYLARKKAVMAAEGGSPTTNGTGSPTAATSTEEPDDAQIMAAVKQLLDEHKLGDNNPASRSEELLRELEASMGDDQDGDRRMASPMGGRDDRRMRPAADREKEREMRQRERDEREYKIREAEWEERERQRDRDLEKEQDRKIERTRMRKERERELEYEEEERRRKKKPRDPRRKRERQKELEDDEADRQRETEELLEADRKAAEEEERKRQEAEAARAMSGLPRFNPAPEPGPFRNNYDAYGFPSPTSSQLPDQPIKLGLSLSKEKPKPLITPGFLAEVEESELVTRKKKPLVPLDFGDLPIPKLDPGKKIKTVEDAKSVIDRIPTTKNELFAYPLNWEVIDAEKIIDKKLKPWVAKKISDYLGEEEATLIDFIIGAIQSKTNAQDILDQLALVLDEEAEVFVVKMFRFLIFEMIRAEQDIESKK